MLSRRSNLWSRASGRSQALSEDPDVKVVQLFADVSLAADLHNVPQSSLGPLAPFMILMSRVLCTVFWGTSTKCFLSPFFYMGFDFELNRCNIPSFSRQAMFRQSFMVFFCRRFVSSVFRQIFSSKMTASRDPDPPSPPQDTFWGPNLLASWKAIEFEIMILSILSAIFQLIFNSN